MLFLCTKNTDSLSVSDMTYVLDTDDLVVEQIRVSDLIHLIKKNVPIRNAKIIGDSTITVTSRALRYLRDYSSSGISMLNGAVKYIAASSEKEVTAIGGVNDESALKLRVLGNVPLQGASTGVETFIIRGHEYHISMAPRDEGMSEIYYSLKVGKYSVNNILLAARPADMTKWGIRYLYRFKDYIIVVYEFGYVSWVSKYLHIIFSLDGKLIGVVPDSSLNCDVYDTGLDSIFISKFITMKKMESIC